MGRTILGAPRKKSSKNAQAVRVGDVIYTSGTPFDWNTMEIFGNTIQEQTKQAMENLKTTLKACGSSMDNVDKCTIFLTSRDYVAGLNEIYYSYFPSDSTPVRACIIADLVHPKMMLEIEVTAHVEKK